MPSDFTSLLFSGDLELTSPGALLHLRESVCDLLPRELQLPSSTQQNPKVMSQKSGGEAGPPPSATVASDAMSSSMTMEGPRSALSNSSSSTIHSSSSASDQNPVHSNNVDQEDARNSRVVPEVVGAENGNGNGGGGGNCRGSSELGGGRGATSQDAQAHHQMTPSKRRTVLNISPPPQDLFDDSHMSCQNEASLDSEQSTSIWMDDSLSNFSIMSSVSYNDNTEVPRKSRKRTPRQRPGPKAVPAGEPSMDVFDADSAKGPHFVLSQLGPDNKTASKGSSDNPQAANHKGGTLSMQYPQKSEGKELKIQVQPETQHRARYLTEGSRGSVKDRTQQSFPTVKLEGVNEPVILQVFVGNDTGRVKPHGFYQACRVTGRNTTACKEVDIDGTTVIEVSLDPSTNMTLAVDCVGILKLRNADVEARIGVAGSKKKSTRARLVFRVNIPRSDGSVLTLQTPSSPILCTQPAGVPEILKKSLHSCSVRGGEEVFIIGKNFLKDTKVIFHENVSDENSWKAEAEIDMELFHQNHLIVKVPPYQNQAVTSAVYVGVYVVTNAGRSHDVQPFTYTPDPALHDVPVKKEMPSPVKTCSFEEQIKVLDGALMPSMLPLVKREEVTPMEVTSNLQSSGVYKTGDLCQTQQNPDMTAGHLNKNRPFSNNLSQAASDPDKAQASVFTNTEPLSTIQKQDIAPTSSFPVPTDSLLQQGSQQFLLEPREGLGQERPGSASGGVGRLCGEPIPQQQQQQQQQQLPLFPPDEVAQLEEAVRQLKAKGFCNLPLQSDNSMAKQQQQQQHMQHQQQIQKQQIQQQQHQQMQQQQQQQQQQTGLLFCNNTLSTPDQASSLLFNSQGQMPPLTSSSLVSQEPQNSSLLFSQSNLVTVNQQDRSEPMALGNPTHPRQQVMFQEQQPMQLGGSSNSRQEPPVGLFMPQSNMASLQGGLAQELAQSAMFAPQNGVANLQTTTPSPVQQPGPLFQTAVSGGINQPSQPQQPGLFLFGIQNGCGQLMNTPGNTLSDQIIAISQSGQNQRESDARIQSLLNQSLSQSGTVQNSMSASQNMEKIDDLLVSLQESGSSLSRSY
ncbi:nuclear factor of activated T-cells 5 isoform X3 [Hippoglossus hippoglossus]|uniref:nuclear factor of activated T-cells 5 isoform X3 n=1 Tax=Hippoglossus hippoglossus TaxID=8267 RepID=UPI00148E2AC4|nr:nuclear factor of activated T-cells 5 isoform X3 [Hippoglossus hippoglossus]